MRRIYDWMMRKAADERAPHALFWVSFAESSFFPIPPDVMLIPMVLANRAKAWWFATLATLGSVIGGVFGYAIGYFVGLPIIDYVTSPETYEKAKLLFDEWGVSILIVKGMTPIPYKLLTITAGVLKMNLVAFIAASVVARAMRFFLVAGLLYWFGGPIRDFIEERLTLVTTVFAVLLVGGFVAVKFLL